jgi:hypothetical protein
MFRLFSALVRYSQPPAVTSLRIDQLADIKFVKLMDFRDITDDPFQRYCIGTLRLLFIES